MKTHGNPGSELRPAARQVLPGLDRLLEGRVDVLPVWTAEERSRTQERERIVLRAGIIDGDVVRHVLCDLLRQVDVDAQEVG